MSNRIKDAPETCPSGRWFLKARARATIGYLNLCIAFMKWRRDKVGTDVIRLRNELCDLKALKVFDARILVERNRGLSLDLSRLGESNRWLMADNDRLRKELENLTPIQINGNLITTNDLLTAGGGLEGKILKKIVAGPDKLINLVIE